MDIVKYPNNMPKDKLAKFAKDYRREFPNNKLIFIPQNFDMIADANRDTLIQLRDSLLNVIDYINEEVNESPDEEKKGVSQEVVNDFLKSKGFTYSMLVDKNKKRFLHYFQPNLEINCEVDLENNSFTLSYSPGLSLAQLTLRSCSPLIDPPDKSYNQFDKMYRQFLYLVQRLRYGD